MWSLWRWVSTSAVSWLAVAPTAAARIEHAAPAVEQEGGAAGAHQRGRPGPLRVDERAPGAEQRDLDHPPSSDISAATMQPAPGSTTPPSYRGAMLGKAHPALAVVAPPRLARFRERLGLADDDPIDADFTGWSKLVLLTPRHAVLFPRDHTQVEPLWRDVAALRAVEPLGLPCVPVVREVFEDPAISAYPVWCSIACPGRPLDQLVEDDAGRGARRPLRGARTPRRRLARGRPGARADPPPPVEPRRGVAARRRARARRPTRPRRPRARSTRARTPRSGARARRPARGAAARRRRPTAPAHRHPRLADRSRRPPLRGVRPRRVGHGALARATAPTSGSSGSARGTPTPPPAACPTTSAPCSSGTTPAPTPARCSASTPFPVEHGPDVVGTAEEARDAVRSALRALPE